MKTNWKHFAALLSMGLLGVFAIFPYLSTLQAEQLAELNMPLWQILILSLIQSSVLLSLCIFFGLKLNKKTKLKAPFTTPLKWPIVLKSIGLGLLAGISIILIDLLFAPILPNIETPKIAIWKAALASFYGGITEEILLRLFMMTLLVWVLSKWTKKPFWSAIIIASLLFGLAHLPTLAAITELTPVLVLRTLLLNAIAGILFGWLYWKKGLEYSMIAHFSTDIVLHVIFPLLTTL